MSSEEPVVALDLFDRLPPRPPAELDRVLDATERCIARFGFERTSMSDLAREMNVARTTLYRQVSSVDEALGLVASRQLHLFVDELAALLAGGGGPQTFIEAVVRAVTLAHTHPVTVRILNHEPEMLGALFNRNLATYASQVVDVLKPLLSAAMDAGAIKVGDPQLAADLILRLIGGLVLIPPDEDDLERVVEYALLPVLEPDRRPVRARR